MHAFKKCVSFLVILAITLCTFSLESTKVSSATITTAYIEGTAVRVRTGPSTSHSIIEKISHTTATVLDKETVGNDVWYKITYDNGTEQITGYIFYDSSYIRIVTYDPDADFETKLKAFPESYRSALRTLHAAYPNWEFIPENITTTFSTAVSSQGIGMRKQVHYTSQPVSWRSMHSDVYNWSTGKWTVTNDGFCGASREIIAYYMDPRNFLNSTEIYMFLDQGYDAKLHTVDGLKQIVAGTFLAGTYSDSSDSYTSYVDVLMEAARQSKVSPYILAAKIIQEIGPKGTSSLVSGTTSHGKYYNFFNWAASGATQSEVIANGLNYAKNMGWTTRSKSIIGGAKLLSDGYISVGQSTFYYQNFNVKNPDKLYHQYAQAIYDARSKGVNLADEYKNKTNYPLVFKIPVFNSMPSSPSPKPVWNSYRNNYYFANIDATGLSPSFTQFNYNYDLAVSGDTTIYIKTLSATKYYSASSFKLKKGSNKVVLKALSESGYTNDYVINVNASKDCTLYVSTGERPQVAVSKGDVDGNGKITINDLAKIRLYLLGLSKLSGDAFTAADIDNNNKITVNDLAKIRLHLLGINYIS